jgi:hypothetical protein
MPNTPMNTLVRASSDADVPAMLAIYAITYRARAGTQLRAWPLRFREYRRRGVMTIPLVVERKL